MVRGSFPIDKWSAGPANLDVVATTSVVEAVVKARDAVRFRYLTAGAVCVYGIPVYSALTLCLFLSALLRRCCVTAMCLGVGALVVRFTHVHRSIGDVKGGGHQARCVARLGHRQWSRCDRAIGRR
ncbi:hypothetical protein BN1723_005155 [Verticillium longisporum]|uniref:Uncharacterized protein n=1 Tax=Verticillium longisporum TaxID=100787 RepID=A0A0G4N4F6_VERLO|nr:hypothetical protein BN1723_005155 [Verticillium longisporum]